MSVLSVKDLSKSYGKHKVLDNVSLEIRPGELVALVGPNGSGKTTFLNCIANVINIDSGTVEILGKPHTDVSIFHKYSYMIDNTVLYGYLTGLDHLKFVCETRKLSKDAVRKAVETIGIKNFITKKVKEYSLGMKQQLLLAMAILNEPDFLVLDEPFNGLDPTTIIKVRKLLMELREQGTTVFLSSHNLAEVDQMTSHIVFVKDGKFIVEDISKYQEDVYFFKVKNPDSTIGHLQAMGQLTVYRENGEIAVKTEGVGLNPVLERIQQMDEIESMRKEIVGAEKRYVSLYGET
ncbi:MAG: ABC transporter ATP-binding protein [Bacillota bacterium]|jgi:ABC-2 type transport system ATP-binding protein|nr:ABC transporter ATP-binding protein [Bacillota bacterium]HOC06503.1 ABC transporter ATP-binding protein [Bacillota bacterium]HPZ22534.1 ABC transporter ATP-binding protein [Bacillota bacterium]HQD19817.1 ABC transporter ATP-binding protein [Bacillota bacterium]